MKPHDVLLKAEEAGILVRFTDKLARNTRARSSPVKRTGNWLPRQVAAQLDGGSILLAQSQS